MASSTPTNTKDLESNPSSSSSPPTPPPPQATWIATNKTTYVQAEPWAFRAVVQKLTGVPEDSPHKLPVSGTPRSSRAPAPPPPPASLLKRQKLQERRRAPAKLEIELGPSSARCSKPHHRHLWSSKPEVAAGFSSPVSPMDPFFFNVFSPSPTTPSPSSLKKEKEEEEEERATVEKGFFYLHPSPRSGGEPPKLLALFPLHCHRDSPP
ncbi:VQ motif-containing protein 11-like [Phoenix dactylifera]|uniref:VQ motif-containing protein 11-like n=1 Tax=Phoenix dactylifera TaxID=42345 RepID=A0A8B7CM23_PHODC|nr:VQ motif-containing protein 11-like [Phoenix dactylifera]